MPKVTPSKLSRLEPFAHDVWLRQQAAKVAAETATPASKLLPEIREWWSLHALKVLYGRDHPLVPELATVLGRDPKTLLPTRDTLVKQARARGFDQDQAEQQADEFLQQRQAARRRAVRRGTGI